MMRNKLLEQDIHGQGHCWTSTLGASLERGAIWEGCWNDGPFETHYPLTQKQLQTQCFNIREKYFVLHGGEWTLEARQHREKSASCQTNRIMQWILIHNKTLQHVHTWGSRDCKQYFKGMATHLRKYIQEAAARGINKVFTTTPSRVYCQWQENNMSRCIQILDWTILETHRGEKCITQ